MNRAGLIACLTIFVSVGTGATTLDELTGQTHSPFVVPVDRQTPGVSHSTMYRYTRAGRAHLLKVIMPGPRLSFVSETFIRLEFEGMSRAAKAGGVEVFAFGRLDGGGFFLDMEEAFPGDNQSFTLKWFVGHPRGGRQPSEVQLRVIAKYMRMALEQGTRLGEDVDLIFGGRDEVRWIDTGDWERLSADITAPGRRAELDLVNFAALIHHFKPTGKGRAAHLLSALHDEITRSSFWTGEQKKAIQANLRGVLIREFQWRIKDYEDAISCQRNLW